MQKAGHRCRAGIRCVHPDKSVFFLHGERIHFQNLFSLLFGKSGSFFHDQLAKPAVIGVNIGQISFPACIVAQNEDGISVVIICQIDASGRIMLADFSAV